MKRTSLQVEYNLNALIVLNAIVVRKNSKNIPEKKTTKVSVMNVMISVYYITKKSIVIICTSSTTSS